MIKEERFKLAPNEKPERQKDYTNKYSVEARGYGPCSSYYTHEKVFYGDDPFDDVDIAIISYFKTGTLYRETANKFFGDLQWNKYNDRCTNEHIYEGPLAFILPYLYDNDFGLGIIDRGWDEIQSIKVFKYDENGVKFECPIKSIDNYFDNINDLVKYVKEQMLIIRPKEEEEEGIMVDPWEIDEAREVLQKAGWNDQELKYLRWIGNCRGFGACIKAPQWMANYLEKHIENKEILSQIFDVLRYANTHCNSLGFNGPSGLCGTYIYRVTENTDKELLKDIEDSDSNMIVRMDDGRVYTLHEGD